MLVQIFDGGNIPTMGDRVFLGYPLEADADDTEGGSPSYMPDMDQPMPIVVINQPAVAGNILVAHAIGGRWVAEKSGQPPSSCVWFCGTNVNISGGFFSVQAMGAASVSGGSVTGVTMTANGSGYTSRPTVLFTGGGTGASAIANLGGGQVVGTTIASSGNGYLTAPAITFTGTPLAGGSVASATCTIGGGLVTRVSIPNPGLGYLVAPNVTFDPPGGSGVTATGVATINPATGALTGITLTNPGSFYYSAPNITIDAPPPGGSQAEATAFVNHVGVVSITITDPGSLYASPPFMTIAPPPPGGSTAFASATVSTISVASISMISGGSGYIDGLNPPAAMMLTFGSFGSFSLPLYGNNGGLILTNNGTEPIGCWWELLTTIQFEGSDSCAAGPVAILFTVANYGEGYIFQVGVNNDGNPAVSCPPHPDDPDNLGSTVACPGTLVGTGIPFNQTQLTVGLSCTSRPYSQTLSVPMNFPNGVFNGLVVQATPFNALFGIDCTNNYNHAAIFIPITISEI